MTVNGRNVVDLCSAKACAHDLEPVDVPGEPGATMCTVHGVVFLLWGIA